MPSFTQLVLEDVINRHALTETGLVTASQLLRSNQNNRVSAKRFRTKAPSGQTDHCRKPLRLDAPDRIEQAENEGPACAGPSNFNRGPAPKSKPNHSLSKTLRKYSQGEGVPSQTKFKPRNSNLKFTLNRRQPRSKLVSLTLP